MLPAHAAAPRMLRGRQRRRLFREPQRKLQQTKQPPAALANHEAVALLLRSPLTVLAHGLQLPRAQAHLP